MGGSLKDDDSATDSDDLNGDLPESSSSLFVDGEKVLAYHGPRIYEAKVISLDTSFCLYNYDYKYTYMLLYVFVAFKFSVVFNWHN